MKGKIFDVIVIGVGSMGSSACYHLAKSGARVLGIEQFNPPHEMGSHAGHTRIIRKAYAEHPDYVPLLQQAYKNWKQLEKETGQKVYHKTGLLYSGTANGNVIKGVKLSAAKFNIKLKDILAGKMKKGYPQFFVPEDFVNVLEPDAGFLQPEKAIKLYIQQAKTYGAVIKTNTKILSWKKKEFYEVKTSAGIFYGKKLVITAGSWAGKLIPQLKTKLNVTRQVLAWAIPNDRKLFGLGNMPCWVMEDENRPGVWYGFPALPVKKFKGPGGFKLAHHYPATPADPDKKRKKIDKKDEAEIKYALHKFFPGRYEKIEHIKICLYTNTPDENFIIDFLPGCNKEIAIAAGFSGHGFKFVSVIGEILKDMALKGKTNLPVAFLSLKRFTEKA